MSSFTLNNCDNNELDDLKLLKKLLKKKKKTKKKKDKYESLKNIKYNCDTIDYYVGLRKTKLDPISMTDINNNAFEYPNMWDPYTGDIQEKDPYGPLYFDPDNLIYAFWKKRLSNLWIRENDSQEGYYEGYYGSGLGIGEDFFIVGRGAHPERYIFRIPIIDIYLTDDHNEQIITLGPKLTDEDVENIYNLSLKNPNNYKKKFKRNRPNIIVIKILFDISISKEPEKLIKKNKEKLKKFNKNINFDLCTCSNCSKVSIISRYNMRAVNYLKNLFN